MKFHYQFSNLLGTVYRKGNLAFSPDGDALFSPVGNKISTFDLKNHKTATLEPENCRSDIDRVAVSPNGVLCLAANGDGEVLLISLISRTVLHKLRTNRPIAALSFSPDGSRFAIAKENNVFIYTTPGGAANKEYNPFVMERVLKGAFDEVTCLNWSTCSRFVAVGSKDMSARIYSLKKFEGDAMRSLHSLGGHTDAVVGVFMERDSLNCYSVSKNGHLVVWECSVEMEDLVVDDANVYKTPKTKRKKKKKSKGQQQPEDEEQDQSEDEIPDQEEADAEKMDQDVEGEEDKKKSFYKRLARFFLKDSLPKEAKNCDLSAASFHDKTKLLVTGFTNGVFFIHEMPDATLIHSLSVSDRGISSITLNPTGDWIAFGCADQGQLLVWEWQSETFVMKQQGHFNETAVIAYSPDAQTIATGGVDGKVKLWSSADGFSYVTFGDSHTSSVTGLAFSPNGRVLVSSSLDGTVRAFDMARYRNFKTFTSPRPAQFGCLALDSSGELIAAGGVDTYEIYLWSMKTGKLLEVISGHEGPVSGIAFSPSPSSSALASVSWDKTLRLWNALSVNSASEIIQISSDATAVAYRPDGNEVAVATLNGHVTFFDTRTASQSGCIEGRKDLGSGRADTDLVTAKKNRDGKAFLTLCYSADGSCILAGGQSNNVCIYHVAEKLLVKKFTVTMNRDFDAVDEVISRKKMSEFGNLALIEDRDDPAGSQKIKLPGARKGDMSSRAFKPEIRVASLRFSPTGRDFACATTEGLLVYSLDTKMVFDPFELDLQITPRTIREAISNGDNAKAVFMSLRLNEEDIIREAMEQVPFDEIDLLARSAPEKYLQRLLKFIAGEAEKSRHVHFYSKWTKFILLHHSNWIRQNSGELTPALNSLQKSLNSKEKSLRSISENNIYKMRFLLQKMKNNKTARKIQVQESDEEESDEEEMEVDEELAGSNAQPVEFMSNWNDDEE